MIKGTRNQMQNISNPYQGKDKKVLCLCSAGLLRSPSTARILSESRGYNTRAAGLDTAYALIPVSEALLVWSDSIVVMDDFQKQQVLGLYEEIDTECNTPIHVMNVPDNYGYMNEILVSIITDKINELDI